MHLAFQLFFIISYWECYVNKKRKKEKYDIITNEIIYDNRGSANNGRARNNNKKEQ